jgi:hypothetical protein
MVFSWIAQALSSPLFGKSLTMFAPIRRADGMVVNIHRSRPTPFPARPAVPRSAVSPIIADVPCVPAKQEHATYTKSRSPARTRSRRRRVALAPKGSNINTQTRRAGGPGNNGARASDNAGSNRPYHHKRAVCTPWSDKLDVPPELIRTSKTLNKSPSACSTAPLRGDPIAMR